MSCELKDILSRVDHTLLAQSARWEEIRTICDDGIRYGCASVCIPASYVKKAADYVAGKIPVCTVIGFPNGYDTTAAKCFEAADAVKNGAEEIDMVINVGWVKDGLYDQVLEEIRAVLDGNDAYTSVMIPAGSYPGQDEEVHSFGSKCILCVDRDMDEELVFRLAELLDEGRGPLSENGGLLSELAADGFMTEGLPVPLHPGAERYFREH